MDVNFSNNKKKIEMMLIKITTAINTVDIRIFSMTNISINYNDFIEYMTFCWVQVFNFYLENIHNSAHDYSFSWFKNYMKHFGWFFQVIHVSFRCANNINQNFAQNSKSPPLPDCSLFAHAFISQIIKPPKWLPNQTKERISFYFFFLFLLFPMACACMLCGVEH